MNNSRLLTLLAAPVVALSLAACDDDGGTGIEGDDLTQAETEAMVDILLAEGLGTALGFGAFGGTFEPSDLPLVTRLAEEIDETFGPFTESCPFGGRVTWSGSATGNLDDETGEGDIDLAFTTVHDDCGLSSEDEDVLFTFTGDDQIDSDLAFVITQQLVELDGATIGGIVWELEDGRSGRCGIDVGFSFDVTETRVVGSMSGTVCGVDVSDDFDEPISA